MTAKMGTVLMMVAILNTIRIIRKIFSLGWSTHLRKLSELYLGQKYDYLVVSTRKCPDIVPKDTNYN